MTIVNMLRSTQQFISQWEYPATTHSTPLLSTRSGADRSWGKSATEATQIAGGSTATSIPAATMSQPLAPAYATPQTCTKSGRNTREKGIQPWAASEWNHGHLHRWHTDPLWPHGPHLLQQSSLSGQDVHSGTMEPDQTWPSGLPQQLGSRNCPWQGSDRQRAERKPHLTSSTGSRY